MDSDSMAHEVFISYSTIDNAIADNICAELERATIRCWMAPRDVQPGRSFAGEITRAIKQSKIMVLVFSEHSNQSQQIVREVELAVDASLPVVQFRIQNIALNDDLKYYLSTPHWIDASTRPLENHLKRLVSSVKTLLGVPAEEQANITATPAPLEVKSGANVTDQAIARKPTSLSVGLGRESREQSEAEVTRLTEEKRKGAEFLAGLAKHAEDTRKAREAVLLAEERRRAEEQARIAEEERKFAEQAKHARITRKKVWNLPAFGNWIRFFIAFIATFVFIFVFGFLYAGLMRGAHQEVPTLWRTQADFVNHFHWLIFGHFVMAFFLTLVCARFVSGGGTGACALLGVLVALVYIGNDFIMYALQPLTTKILWGRIFGELSQFAIAGAIIGAVTSAWQVMSQVQNNSGARIDWKKFFLAFIAAFVFLFAFGLFWQGKLMHGAFQEAPTLWRTETDFTNHFSSLVFGYVMIAFSIALLCERFVPESGAGPCTGLGVLVAIVYVGNDFFMYAVQPLTMKILSGWIFGDVIIFAIAGAIVGAIYKPAPARSSSR